MPSLTPTNGAVPNPAHNPGIGGWLPNDAELVQKHVKHLLTEAKRRRLKFVPPIQELQDLINKDPTVFMLFTEMLIERPYMAPYDKDASLKPTIANIPDLLVALNHQIQTAISWNHSPLIACPPIYAILDWPMGTKAGFAAFQREDVNAIFKRMLQHWAKFLEAPPSSKAYIGISSISTVTTADGGWLSPAAQNDPRCPGLFDFLNTYEVPDARDAVHYGFKTWDQFFLRCFRPGKRPLASPDDASVIVSPCEATPFYMQTGVKLTDTFWAKNRDARTNYSLAHMLGDVDMAKRFVGGTVYQAFLGADAYHQWHAPVSGRYIAHPKVLPGTFYSVAPVWGSNDDESEAQKYPEVGADHLSQSYRAAVAQRGVAFIQADNTAIGLMAIIMIGMAEVSSVDFDNVSEFRKGDNIGRFHFGGSTYCLVFGPDVRLNFAAETMPPADILHPASRTPVLSELARVLS